MPYRRLPNTDQARIRALRTALEESDRQHLQLVIDYKTQHNVKVMLQKFEQTMGLYKQTYDNQVRSNKDFQMVFRNARLYISHFIQVLNLAVQREEIKKEYKKFYHLDPDDFSVPDMVSSESLIEWGQNIVEGEASRLKSGGIPIYNPAIAKVKVHYDIFKDFRDNQVLLQQNTSRYADKVNDLRQPVDELILEIWNQIEGFFGELPPYTRMETCKRYGVIYYYRKGESELTPADDLPKPVVEQETAVADVCAILATASPEVTEITVEADIQVKEEPVIIDQQEFVTDHQDTVVEIVLEKMEEPVVFDTASSVVPEEIKETTLFAEEMAVAGNEPADAQQQDSELKIKEIMPKKRNKRTAKQDALLSLFFQ